MKCAPETIKIRHAGLEDLSEITRIYSVAREFMRTHNNPTQWGDSYPSVSLLRTDILCHQLFVIECEEKIRAVFAMIQGKDPTYSSIDGAWKDATPYVTIHRVASDGTIHGVLAKSVCFAKLQCPHIRIDTHHDNFPMQQAILREGFLRCGIIHLTDGSPRIAYEMTRSI